jgi:hypothetical protein
MSISAGPSTAFAVSFTTLRRRSRRAALLLPLALLAAMVALIAAPAARADEGWRPAQFMAFENAEYRNFGPPRIAVNERGAAIAAWTANRTLDRNFELRVSRRPPGGPWSAPVTIFGPSGDDVGPHVAIDPSGTAIVSWGVHNGAPNGEFAVEAAVGLPDGTWSQPARVSGGGIVELDAGVVLDRAGNAVSVWVQKDGGNTSVVMASTRAPGGRWTAPERLSARGGLVQEVAFGTDASGAATVVWNRLRVSEDRAVVEAVERPSGGRWGASEVLGTSDDLFRVDLRLAVGPSGAAAAAFGDRLAVRDPGGGWSRGVNPFGPVVVGREFELAVDADGEAFAVFEARDEEVGRWVGPAFAHRPPRGRWSEPAMMDSDGTVPHLALDAAGDLFAAWPGPGIQVARRPAGGEWADPEAIDGSWAVTMDEVSLAVDPSGTAIVGWRTNPGDGTPGYSIRTAVRTAVPDRPGAVHPVGSPPDFVPTLALPRYFTWHMVPSYAEAVAVADITGDGRDDVLMTTPNTDPRMPARLRGLVLFVQDGRGKLGRPSILPLDGEPAAMSLSVGDLDGDGRPDAAVTTKAGVQVLLNRGGRLVRQAPVPAGTRPNHLVIADLDGEGPDEIVVGNATGLLAVSRERGGFAARAVAPIALHTFDVGDLDGDGRPDVVGRTPLLSGGDMMIVTRKGAPAGRWAVRRLETGSEVFAGQDGIALADVTGDGRTDLILPEGGNFPTSSLRVLPQARNGEVDPPVVRPSFDIPAVARAADLNGDGRTDVAVLHSGWQHAGLYLQRPDGSLAPEILFPLPYGSYGPQALAVGELTGDGRLDLAIADPNSGLVVLRVLDRPFALLAPPGSPDAGWVRIPNDPAPVPSARTPPSGAVTPPASEGAGPSSAGPAAASGGGGSRATVVAPEARPAAAPGRPRVPSAARRSSARLTVADLRITQRIAQAALRRVAALEARLGLGHAVRPAARPSAIRLRRAQLRTNQRIAQAALRRATRLRARLLGLPDPPAMRTRVRPIQVTMGQVRITRRIAQAALRRVTEIENLVARSRKTSPAAQG